MPGQGVKRDGGDGVWETDGHHLIDIDGDQTVADCNGQAAYMRIGRVGLSLFPLKFGLVEGFFFPIFQ